MELRTAVDADGADIARLLTQLGYRRDPDSIRADIASRAFGEVIVAVDEARVVALLTLTIRRQLHWGESVATIEALVVDEGARSAGIGAALVGEAVTRAVAQHCLLIEVHSNLSRARAHRFYERAGFARTSAYFVRQLRS